MSWNFDYIFPTVIVFVFFLSFYFLKPIFLTHSNRRFFALLLSEIVAFILELITCLMDKECGEYNISFVYFINTLSFLTFFLRYALVAFYLASICGVNIRKDFPSLCTWGITVVTVVLVITAPTTELIYYYDNNGCYQRSFTFFIFYVACCIPLLLSVYYIFRFGAKAEKVERLGCFLAIITLIVSCIFKVVLGNYLITDAFFAFVLMGLFFIFENPDILIDRRTGLLNFSAFQKIISEYITGKRKYSILSFSINNYSEKRQIYCSMQSELALKEIGKFFLSLSHYRKCFYLRNGNFVIVDKTDKKFNELKEIVQHRFEQPWVVNEASIDLDIITIDMSDDVSLSTFDDISAGFGYSFADAKKANLKNITITKDSFVKINRRAKVSIALNKALLEDSLQVYLQPIVDANTRKIVAAEALVRIHDEELGIIPPVEFISMAEKNGSIEKLGEQVLNKVCIFLKESEIYKKGIQWINVNLSPIQCQNKDLTTKIDLITNNNTIDHKYIHLEITEESIIDSEVLKTQMTNLIMDGYKFSLDDFGSGFSNVTRVQRFPFNNIKLDMSVVQEHTKNPDEILPSVVKSFNNRGLSVTAEGVETKEVADMLTDMGCTYLQGYYFSKPIPTKDFEKLINEQQK